MKPTYHVLARSLDENFEADYQTSDKPFGFAPLDTIYGHDFNVLVYVDAATKPMDAFDILMVTGAAAQEICRAIGMVFHKFEFPGRFQSAWSRPCLSNIPPKATRQVTDRETDLPRPADAHP